MDRLFRFPRATRRDAAVDDWLEEHSGELGDLAGQWFDAMRGCGEDVTELVHDHYPTACVTPIAGEAGVAFAYVGAFKAHVNVGFFRGVELPDPLGFAGGDGQTHATRQASAG